MGLLLATPSTELITKYDATNNCHKTELKIKGTPELFDFKKEVWTMTRQGKITKDVADLIEGFSDGYHIESTITLGADIGANQVAGTCFGLPTADKMGRVCHTIENTSNAKEVKKDGHNIIWFSPAKSATTITSIDFSTSGTTAGTFIKTNPTGL